MIKLKSIILCFLVTSFSFAIENVTGTKIYMSPPDSFVQSKEFKGYINQTKDVHIYVIEESIPINEYNEYSSDSILNTQNIKVLSRENLKIGLPNSLLLLTQQSRDGIRYYKWTISFGNKKSSVFVIGIFQEKDKEKKSESIKQSLLTVEWKKDIEVDLLSEVPFTLSENKNFKVVKKITDTYILTKNERFELGACKDPYIAFAYNNSENDLKKMDFKELSTIKLSNSEHINKIHILNEKRVILDSLPGYLIEAKGWNKHIKNQFYVVQCVLFSTDMTFLIEAYSMFNKKEKYKNDFMNIIKSFKLKD